jgi:Arc/MetJ-type ribon-helix-helix transcriptional regulator
MATTLNISLSPEQAAWVKSRRDEAGFASASDVIRDLIRRERDKELAALESEFEKMDQRDGGEGPAPVKEIVTRVRKIRKALLKRHEARRRS